MTNLKVKIKKGDTVVVISGKDKGKTGEALKVFPKDSKILVSGVAISKKNQKATQQSEGGIIEKEMPIHISNVAFLDPKQKKATKLGYKFNEEGKKIRYAKLSGEVVDK